MMTRTRTWLCVVAAVALVAGCFAADMEPVAEEDDEAVSTEEIDRGESTDLLGDRGTEEFLADEDAEVGEARSHPKPLCNRYDQMPCPPGSPPRICYLVYPSEPGICYCSAQSGLWECD